MYGKCECGGERVTSGADVMCNECGKITPGIVFPSWEPEFRIKPPAGFCVLCGGVAKLGGVYYRCSKCETLGNIHEDGKVYPVSGTAEQLEKTHRVLEKQKVRYDQVVVI